MQAPQNLMVNPEQKHSGELIPQRRFQSSTLALPLTRSLPAPYKLLNDGWTCTAKLFARLRTWRVIFLTGLPQSTVLLQQLLHLLKLCAPTRMRAHPFQLNSNAAIHVWIRPNLQRLGLSFARQRRPTSPFKTKLVPPQWCHQSRRTSVITMVIVTQRTLSLLTRTG